MIDSELPAAQNENERLKVLQSYDILDTFPEEEYDAITRLTSYICQVPLAFITFIDDKRQWFKSNVGLQVTEIPRAGSFCRYTIQDDILVEVPDASLNERFSDSDLVTGEMGIRFYASAPLVDTAGYRLGSLCVFDKTPKVLSPEQRDAMKTLASEVMSHLALRKQKKELELSLQQHKDYFRLFNSSSEIHYIADAASKIEQINNAVETILGYKPHEVIGRSLWEFVVDQNRQQYADLIEQGIRTKQAFELESCVVTRSGEVKCISWSAINRDGKWYASGRDVTEQRKIQAELQQLSLVASKVSNGVAITDAHNKVIWINDSFQAITGFDLTDLYDKQMGDVLGGDYTDAEVKQRVQRLLQSEKFFEIDIRIQHKSGHLMWISILNSPIMDREGKVEKYIKVIIDITARKNVEQELEVLSFASRKSPSGILIRDKDAHVIWMNEALEDFTGYTFQEMKGKKFSRQLLGKDSDLTVFNKAIESINNNKPYEVEIKIYTKSGVPKWAYFYTSPFFNEEGTLERQITICVDIDERKKVEEQLNTLSLVASSTGSGVIINDSDGNVEWVNSAFEKITGYDLSAVKNKHVGDVLNGELTDSSVVERLREMSKNKQSFEIDLLAYRKDGKPIWLSLINSVVLNSDGKINKYVEVIIDITEKKKAELELMAAKEEALQLNTAKDMFISVMSHEIRTPLNAVIGMSHLLAEDNPTPSQKENLDILKFSAENLMTLINDVLDFTKIETGNVELERAEVDIRELMHSVTSSMRYKANDKNIYLKKTVDPEIPQLIIGDRTRLVQILLNLVNNAIKFTDAGGITIDLKVLEQTDNSVSIHFAVTDTGIGIPANKIDTIFESFKQASSDTTRKYGGTGLGLPITKRLIELHHSHIQVNSIQDEGSTFSFTISFEKAQAKVTKHVVEAATTLNLSVLVVDDNQINRLLVDKVLKRWGLKADFAENGLEAIEKIEADVKYDVVLMDIHMPQMGGLEASRVIRAKPEAYFKNLPIIALTASVLTSQIDDLHEAGMNDFMLKPFEPKTLYEKLSRYQP